MFTKQLRLVSRLLQTAVLLLTLVVGTLTYLLATDGNSLTGQEEWGCAIIDEVPYSCFVIPQEVIKNETGRALFKDNCAQCHDFHAIVVGPPLAGVQERHTTKWLKAYVQNSAAMVEQQDSAAVAVYQAFAKQEMPAFALSNAELDSLLEYVAAQPVQL